MNSQKPDVLVIIIQIKKQNNTRTSDASFPLFWTFIAMLTTKESVLEYFIHLSYISYLLQINIWNF